MKLPSTVNFGGGYRVRIREMADNDYDAAFDAAGDAAFIIADDPYGSYIGTVFYRKSVPKKDRLMLVLHELLHALNDAYHMEVMARYK